MFRSVSRFLVMGAVAAALLVVSLGNAASVSASIDPLTFQKLGCNVGDYNCFYAKLYGGAPLYGNYCDGYGNCTYNPPPEALVYGSGYGSPYSGGYGSVYQYQDGRYCGDGQITYANGVYTCTTTGVPLNIIGGPPIAVGPGTQLPAPINVRIGG